MPTAKIHGVNLHYDVHGTGEPILFVHGFPLSGRMWDPIVEPMGDAFKLIVPDLRGLGASDVTPDATMATYVQDLVGLLDAIGETRPIALVGLSMGGYVSFEFVRRHADRLRALVLVDTRAGADPLDIKRNRTETADRVLAEGSQVVADIMADKLFGPQAGSDLRAEWHQIMSASDPRGVAAALGAMRDRTESQSLLPDVRIPTLVVVGIDDVITPVDTARAMHENIPGARLEIVPGAGHMVPVEQPDRFAQVLTRFLESLPG